MAFLSYFSGLQKILKASFHFSFGCFQLHLNVVVVALVVAGIAKLCDRDFEDWFKGSFAVMAIIEVILGIILLFS